MSSSAVKTSDVTPAELYKQRVSNLKDERDFVQKKVFTKWCNIHLSKVRKEISDLFEDFRDGKKLLSLLELITDDKFPYQNGGSRFHFLQNVNAALLYLKTQNIKIINIRGDDIVDGNSKLTLGLIWIIILHYQVSNVKKLYNEESLSPKHALLLWCKSYSEGYTNVQINNFTTSWTDGYAFNAILHRNRPDLVDYESLPSLTPSQRLQTAFMIAEKELGVPKLLDPQDVMNNPDEKSLMTYISVLNKAVPSVPPKLLAQKEEEFEVKFNEYHKGITIWIKWINQGITRLENREFPNQLPILEDLASQLSFLVTDIVPEKQAAKRHIFVLYRDLKLMDNPQNKDVKAPERGSEDIEKLWYQFLEAIERRKKDLRAAVDKLKHLDHIAEKINTDASLLEASLDDVENEVTTLEQSELDRERLLDKFDQIRKALLMFRLSIKTMNTSIQILVDGEYPESEKCMERMLIIVARWEALKVRLNTSVFKLDGKHTVTEIIAIDEPLISPIEVRNQNTVPDMEEQSDLFVDEPVEEITFTSLVEQSPANGASYGENGDDQRVKITRAKKRSSIRLKFNFKRKKDSPPKAVDKQGTSKKKSKKDRNFDGEEEPTVVVWNETSINIKLQEVRVAFDWVKHKLGTMADNRFGIDLPKNETLLKENEELLHRTQNFRIEVDKVSCYENTEPPEEVKNKIVELQQKYTSLETLLSRRYDHLKTLVLYLRRVTEQLITMNQKEETELSRDWSDKNVDIPFLVEVQKVSRLNLERSEEVVEKLTNEGQQLISKDHPAFKTIEVYIVVLHTQFEWLKRLNIAFAAHLEQTKVYSKFFEEAAAHEKILVETVNFLKTLLNGVDLNDIRVLIIVIRTLIEIRQKLIDYHGPVCSLVKQSPNVPPLKKRREPVKEAKSVITVCDFSNEQDAVNRGDKFDLTDNSDPLKWKVVPPSSVEELQIPSVCFVIPAPDVEATELATRIEIQYRHLLTLWKNRQWHVKQAATSSEVLTKLQVLKSPDIKKFEVPEVTSVSDIENLLKALGEDLDPDVISEDEAIVPDLETISEQFISSQYVAPDQQAMDISEEEITPEKVEDVESEMPLAEEEDPEKVVERHVDELFDWCIDIEQEMVTKEHACFDFENIQFELQKAKADSVKLKTVLQPKYDSVLERENLITTSQTKYKVTILKEKWEVIVITITEYEIRVIHVHHLLLLANDMEMPLKRIQDQLGMQHGITADSSDLQRQLSELTAWQVEYNTLATSVQKLKELSNQLKVEKFVDTNKFLDHWREIGEELESRICALSNAIPKAVLLKDSLYDESQWLNETYKMLERDELVPLDEEEKNDLLETYKIISRQIPSHRESIQKLFFSTEQYILYSMDFDKKLGYYRKSTPSCEYIALITYQSRQWLGRTIVELTKIYELILTIIPQRIDILVLKDLKHNTDDDSTSDIGMVNPKLLEIFQWVQEKESQLAVVSPQYLDPESLDEFTRKLHT